MLIRLTFCTIAALTISACAPSGGDGEDEPTRAPFGYEFAQNDSQGTTKISTSQG